MLLGLLGLEFTFAFPVPHDEVHNSENESAYNDETADYAAYYSGCVIGFRGPFS